MTLLLQLIFRGRRRGYRWLCVAEDNAERSELLRSSFIAVTWERKYGKYIN
jgi:hypothetical protein